MEVDAVKAISGSFYEKAVCDTLGGNGNHLESINVISRPKDQRHAAGVRGLYSNKATESLISSS